MATSRPFDFGTKNYLDLLNDLMNIGMPRIKEVSADPESAGVNIAADRLLVFEDSGSCVDVVASANLTIDPSCLSDGWSLIVYVVTGIATITASTAGTTFVGGAASKTIAAGNAAIISCNGSTIRIFRFSAAT